MTVNLTAIELFCLSRGLEQMPPEPMITEHFSDTFCPSAFHDHVWCAAGMREGAIVEPSFGTQWVYRHVDLGSAAYSPAHLIAFQMFVTLRAHSETQRAASLAEFVDMLLWVLGNHGIAAGNLKVTVPGVNNHCGKKQIDSTLRDTWREAGLLDSQIIDIDGPALYAVTREPGHLSGPRSEVFAKHPVLGFVEVATLVTEMWCLSKHGDVVRSPNQVSGFACGVERLDMFQRDCEDVLTLIWPKKDRHSSMMGDTISTHQSAVSGLIKGLHAASVLRSELNLETPTPYLRRFRQLLRHIERCQFELGLAPEMLDKIAFEIPEVMKRLPDDFKARGAWDYLSFKKIEEHVPSFKGKSLAR